MDHTQVVKALYATATLIEEDEARTAAAHGAPTGVPVSMADRLIGLACTGPAEEWRTEWIRLASTEGVPAAKAWGERQQELKRHVFDLMFPNGLHSPALGAEEVRAIADQIQATDPSVA
ncbi:hypothetical protein [Streptomyces sp. BE133]|uniref:hypothetical protein n=1 Tax=Streptomyces sp. BE133 TaxID=3002523 RepID=UPI002E77E8BD|nr:hypothetical protein [Streptomyces sp. BE133]MEE1812651.1 hypothetical protein [Streptomyces sp. BE133]